MPPVAQRRGVIFRNVETLCEPLRMYVFRKGVQRTQTGPARINIQRDNQTAWRNEEGRKWQKRHNGTELGELIKPDAKDRKDKPGKQEVQGDRNAGDPYGCLNPDQQPPPPQKNKVP